jgi:hypothetical protein
MHCVNGSLATATKTLAMLLHYIVHTIIFNKRRIISEPQMNCLAHLMIQRVRLTGITSYLQSSRCFLDKTTRIQLVKKFPAFLRKPKIHYRIHNSPPRVPILRQITVISDCTKLKT